MKNQSLKIKEKVPLVDVLWPERYCSETLKVGKLENWIISHTDSWARFSMNSPCGEIYCKRSPVSNILRQDRKIFDFDLWKARSLSSVEIANRRSLKRFLEELDIFSRINQKAEIESIESCSNGAYRGTYLTKFYLNLGCLRKFSLWLFSRTVIASSDPVFWVRFWLI